ncbi:hypothetical protein [Halegenticoccus soli]|uniref:hypothetical protein n=1 Tax=Halegenticoccus soli TaxID=1985678 RepID=UPI000C6CA389|nr:hypothetical protein [Halegenticoccus soli]
MPDLLIYGSYGYTGSLIAREDARRGVDPILAGRDAEAVSDQAGELGLDARTFGAEDAATPRRRTRT